MTFTADTPDAAIQPGQFRDFGLSVGMPDEAAGTELEFPSLQTYDNGDVVRWIGPADSEEPAPVVTLTAAEEEQREPPSRPRRKATMTTAGSDGLAIAGLIVGALGLIAGGTALARSRRTS